MNFKLLKALSEVAGPSGFESRIREMISKEIAKDVDSVTTDNMGNLVAFRKGKSDKKLMIAAHMDEIGFIVTHIDDNGFLKFATLGGFDPKTLTAQRVIVHGKKDVIGVMGAKPIHVMTPEERDKKVTVKDFFIDLGMTKKEVEKIIEIGTPISRERECIEMGSCVNGKSLDNRIAVYILIETIKKLKGKQLPFDTYSHLPCRKKLDFAVRKLPPSTSSQIMPSHLTRPSPTMFREAPRRNKSQNLAKDLA